VPTEIFFTILPDGSIQNKKSMAKFFSELNPGRYSLVSKSANTRSLPQNAYFHGPMLDYVFNGLRDMGFDDVQTKEDAKLVVKSLFLKKQIGSTETGEVIEIIRDTASLTKEEFNLFIEEVQRWAATFLNVVIPDPGTALQAF